MQKNSIDGTKNPLAWGEKITKDSPPLDKTDMTYWLPMLEDAGIPSPKTILVTSPNDLIMLCDGDGPLEWYYTFIKNLGEAADQIGYPCFLRSGMTSAKHMWRSSCFLDCRKNLGQHVYEIIEHSAICDIAPTTTWAVREMLPTKASAILSSYGDFPLVPEVRVFVGDGEIICWQNYWPIEAIIEGFPRSKEDHSHIVPDNFEEIVASLQMNPEDFLPLAKRVAEAFKDDGKWSVDILKTEKGLYVTDLAEFHKSYHGTCRMQRHNSR